MFGIPSLSTRKLLVLILLSPALMALLGYAGFIHPAFDTLANFIWHIAIAAIFAGALLFILRLRIFAIASLVIGVAGLYFTAAPVNSVPPIANENTYSLLHLNLYYKNPSPEKVLELVNARQPDIVMFNEVSTKWQQRLLSLDEKYPHNFHCPEWDRIGGSKIWSKIPFIAERGYCHAYAALALQRIRLEEEVITLGSVHLRWPWPASGPQQVTAMRPVLEGLDDNAIVVGDFNSAPWTHLLRRFSRYADLDIVSVGKTWMYRRLPTELAKWIGLPIDIVTHKGNIQIVEAKTLEPVGSDHLPVWVRFAVVK